jgi:acetylornithine deacetylase
MTLTVPELLADLVAFPSVGGTTAEAGIQHRLAEWMDDLGLEVDLWPIDLDTIRAQPEYPGEEVTRAQAWGLVGTHRSGDQPQLILQGHVDVVPTGDPAAWSSDPFVPTVVDGAMVGRGTCDMKGGVAAILGAVGATRASGADVPPYAVHLVIGEEDGGLGAFATLERGHTGDACIIPEPTNLELVTAAAGSLTFRIEVAGLATHGSTRYAGVSAIDVYLPIHAALARLEARRNTYVESPLRDRPIAYPLSVGRLQAGDWASSVPDRLIAEGRYGLRIEEEPASAQRELAETVAEAAAGSAFLRDHPPVVTWPGGMFRGGQLPAGHQLMAQVGDAHHAITGRACADPTGVPYGSDLRLYAGRGIPTLHYGPGDVRLAHGPNESVPLQQVQTAADVFTRMLRRSA